MHSVWAYARYGFINGFQLALIGFMIMGGPWMWAGLVLAGGFILLDEVFEDRATRTYKYPWLFNALLYLNLPSLLAISVVFGFYLGERDPLGIAVIADTLVGVDLIARREAVSVYELFGAGLTVALFYGAAGINAAHELSHRTYSAVDQAVARWMLAFTWDTTFPIEHVYGHHRHVGTERDPATARRGEYILAFMLRSTVGCFINAFKIEHNRLTQIGKPVWSLSNRALRGQAMSLVYCLGFYWLAGWTGMAVFLALAVNGKMYLEAVNYIEHYGLVRISGRPVESRHSWDCYNSVSTTFLYNLTRHADHHIHSTKPYWHNRIEVGAMSMPHGYMTMILSAFLPSVWHRLMIPRLAFWDTHLASDEERAWLSKHGLVMSSAVTVGSKTSVWP